MAAAKTKKLTKKDLKENPALAQTVNPATGENFKVGDTYEIPGTSTPPPSTPPATPPATQGTDDGEKPQPPAAAPKAKKSIPDAIRAAFETHDHVLTIWVNPADDSEWYFVPRPGFKAIERNEVIK